MEILFRNFGQNFWPPKNGMCILNFIQGDTARAYFGIPVM